MLMRFEVERFRPVSQPRLHKEVARNVARYSTGATIRREIQPVQASVATLSVAKNAGGN
jgi:hypothetical protein